MAADIEALRDDLASAVHASGAANDHVFAALRTVPRHVFLPDVPPEEAYRDDAIVTKRNADGQPISSSSQPTLMAIMLRQLDIEPGARVLEIGAGTGYNAALLAHLVGPSGHVVTVDIDQDVAVRARANLAAAGFPDVTVICADGAAGYAPAAPYDRIIATVGVWDLEPAWLDQLTATGRIVVPLDLRGVHRSIAFERAGDHWTSRSVMPCGFMRIRGSAAGPEWVRVLATESELTLTVPDPHDGLDAAALLAAWDAPGVDVDTGVVTDQQQVSDGLCLWLAMHEPRWCIVSERTRTPSRLRRAPLGVQDLGLTVGLIEGTSVAELAWAPDGPTLTATGHGDRGAGLAADLVGQVRAWDAAGRPGTRGLRIDAYPKPAPDGRAADAIEKTHTMLVLSRTAPPENEA
ncbi:MAG TPA: methyltransferase, FxLD system [Pseudonocardiaceae bacterium]